MPTDRHPHDRNVDDGRAWVEHLRRGDPAAWRELVAELGGDVAGYARSKGVSDADDLVSDVFEALASRIIDFEGGARALRSFAFTIAHHRIADHHRRRSTRPTSEELDDAIALPDATDHDRPDHAAGSVDAMRLIDSLPPDQREVMLLHTFGQLQLNEIADVLGKRPGTIRQLQLRARRRLRKQVEGGVTR